ncbi:phycobilisome protein [Calothrix rhizosoleniae]|uniref:phycobilisome protein n=1 Tax=Calothrix rhizosoleniae TaxID=888997 RepID=UPI000B49E9EF|nr:phycobilisome protein [Calothrix rhizosoleniae]
MVQLSAKAKELIAKARIVGFASWQTTHPQTAIAIFQAADDEGRYLTDEDLQQIQVLSPGTSVLIPVAKMLRDCITEIVDEARAKVLQAFPNILQPGGGLYPPFRAEACWRDFWHFSRCINYGIAGGSHQFTSEQGLGYMKLLYEELNVPLDAMVLGLEGIKIASLQRVEPEQQRNLAPYFDHLIYQLSHFQDS